MNKWNLPHGIRQPNVTCNALRVTDNDGDEFIKKRIPFFFILFLSLLIPILSIGPIWASSGTIHPEPIIGKVTDTVRCKNHPEQSYALYLPESYMESVKWPVLFIFDPGGRGSLAVDSFKIAAGKYGYILAASNNSSSGSLEKIVEIAEHLFEDVSTRFSVDSARIYTAGYSSGSRAAMAIAILNDKVSGVIGCGAGLPAVSAYQPKTTSKFVYYGFVGDRDMNYQEMFDLRDQLKHLGLKARLEVFHGGHQWPSSGLLSGALEWSALQEMKTGGRVKVDSIYRNYFETMIRSVDQRRSEKDLFEVAWYYRYLLEDFPDGSEITKYANELTALEDSKEYKKAIKNWEKTRKKELSYREDCLKAFDRILITQSLPDSILHWWEDEIGSLKKDSVNKSRELRLMSIRLLNMITATCTEWGWMQMESKRYTTASSFFKIWTVIEPEEMHSWLNLARSYAFLSDTKQCLTALREAMKHGLKTKQKLKKDEAFGSIRNEKAFMELLDKLQ